MMGSEAREVRWTHQHVFLLSWTLFHFLYQRRNKFLNKLFIVLEQSVHFA